MDATTAGVFASVLAVALGMMKLLEMFARPLIEDRVAQRRRRSSEGVVPHHGRCRLSEEDRDNLIETQTEILRGIERACQQAANEERVTRAEHGAKLDVLIQRATRG